MAGTGTMGLQGWGAKGSLLTALVIVTLLSCATVDAQMLGSAHKFEQEIAALRNQAAVSLPTLAAAGRETGAADTAGETGAEDTAEETGATDRAGETGAEDTAGETGATDTAGETGAADTAGETGAEDTAGETGAADTAGDTGAADTAGETGGTGAAGKTGAARAAGAARGADMLDPPGDFELPSEDVGQAMMSWAEKTFRTNAAKRDAFQPLSDLRDSPPSGKVDPALLDYMFLPLYPCPMEVRVGDWGDGGKWLCLSHAQRNKNPKVVVSVGSRGDTSFEAAVFRGLGARSHTLDFSLNPERLKRVSSLPFVTFHPVGLRGSTDKRADAIPELANVTWVNFQEMLALTGRDYIDILKIDCEMCEYAVIQDLKESYTRLNVPIGQILVELHLPARVQSSFPFLDALEGLGFRLFHAEINRFTDVVFRNYHYELAFIHESLVVST